MPSQNPDLIQDQLDFFIAMGSPSVVKGDNLQRCATLASDLIYEEAVMETLPALRQYQDHPTLENKVHVADGLIDTIYVCLHACHSLDIPAGLVWREVQRSNMAKLQPDGTVRKREDGKILKPSGWTPPNIWEVLKEYDTEQQMGADYVKTGMVK